MTWDPSHWSVAYQTRVHGSSWVSSQLRIILEPSSNAYIQLDYSALVFRMSDSFVEQPEDFENYVPGALTQAERWWIHYRPWLEQWAIFFVLVISPAGLLRGRARRGGEGFGLATTKMDSTCR